MTIQPDRDPQYPHLGIIDPEKCLHPEARLLFRFEKNPSGLPEEMKFRVDCPVCLTYWTHEALPPDNVMAKVLRRLRSGEGVYEGEPEGLTGYEKDQLLAKGTRPTPPLDSEEREAYDRYIHDLQKQR